MGEYPLPVVHEDEGRGPLARLRRRLNELDGPLSISTAHVPDADEVPRARELDYAAGKCGHDRERGMHFLFDGPHIRLAGETYVRADDDTFISDVREWA